MWMPPPRTPGCISEASTSYPRAPGGITSHGSALLPASARVPGWGVIDAACLAVACLVPGGARPAPLVLGLALVVLLSIPWGLAVAHRLANRADSAIE
jgi:hypothetical protein